MIITIDGPAGGGKSTAARNLARRLGIPFLDTGAMYRAMTLKVVRLGVDCSSAEAVSRLLATTTIEVTGREDRLHVLLDGEDVTGLIRTPEITAAIRQVAGHPDIRNWMAKAQREIGERLGSLVSEGRDQGTVVFPDADVKFFLVADIAARARRRQAELFEGGILQDEASIQQAIAQRDREDEERAVAPLCRPAEAVLIDTTRAGPDETAEVMAGHVFAKTGGRVRVEE